MRALRNIIRVVLLVLIGLLIALLSVTRPSGYGADHVPAADGIRVQLRDGPTYGSGEIRINGELLAADLPRTTRTVDRVRQEVAKLLQANRTSLVTLDVSGGVSQREVQRLVELLESLDAVTQDRAVHLRILSTVEDN